MGSNRRRVSPAVFFLAMVCFFLPFVTLSCAGERIESFTGFQLVAGTELKQPGFFGQVETQKVSPEPLAFLAFLCIVAGLGSSFFSGRKPTGAAAIGGGLGFLLLLALRFKLDGDVARQGQGMIQVSYELGFYLATILFLLAASLSAYFLFFEGKPIPLPLSRHAQGYKFCAQCGSRNSAANLFCEECGAKLA